jgi:hypothetical protein
VQRRPSHPVPSRGAAPFLSLAVSRPLENDLFAQSSALDI